MFFIIFTSWQNRGGAVQFPFKRMVQPSPHAPVIWT
jgi:hypothetical protein